jgi:hypothetical protein
MSKTSERRCHRCCGRILAFSTFAVICLLAAPEKADAEKQLEDEENIQSLLENSGKHLPPPTKTTLFFAFICRKKRHALPIGLILNNRRRESAFVILRF